LPESFPWFLTDVLFPFRNLQKPFLVFGRILHVFLLSRRLMEFRHPFLPNSRPSTGGKSSFPRSPHGDGHGLLLTTTLKHRHSRRDWCFFFSRSAPELTHLFLRGLVAKRSPRKKIEDLFSSFKSMSPLFFDFLWMHDDLPAEGGSPLMRFVQSLSFFFPAPSVSRRNARVRLFSGKMMSVPLLFSHFRIITIYPFFPFAPLCRE